MKNPIRTLAHLSSLLVLLCAIPSYKAATAASNSSLRYYGDDPLTTLDPSGWLRTYTPSGAIDLSNPFFQSLGSNSRSCSTCHVQEDGWSVSAQHVRTRFNASQGTDPIFRTVDGANSPLADVSTKKAQRQAYSMLLKYGVIRVGLPIPSQAEFTLTAANDPYGYASAAELSLFRRPMPTTNLRFLTGVMWDGRETAKAFLPPMDAATNHSILVNSLRSQARDAVLGHAQGSEPTEEELAQIVDFEMSLTTAQIQDNLAGRLNGGDAIGGPRVLANQHFYIGADDALGADPTGMKFNSKTMMLFDAWASSDDRSKLGRARMTIARGEILFNTMPITITGVAGLNDMPGMETIQGHCSTCHNTPNVGNHSIGAPLNIGISDASQRTPDMPLYTLTNIYTGATTQTTDPGLALITGKWEDIGKFKGPILRGLAARAPYFHNGSAATLDDAIDFYNTRFNIGITPQQKHDLVAFLSSL
jgi:cytochrome c peroxidase